MDMRTPCRTACLGSGLLIVVYVLTIFWQGSANVGVYAVQNGQMQTQIREADEDTYLKTMCGRYLKQDAPEEAKKALLIVLRTNLAAMTEEERLKELQGSDLFIRIAEQTLLCLFTDMQLDTLIEETRGERYICGDAVRELPFCAVCAGESAPGQGAYSYLKSVESRWDVEAQNYLTIHTYTKEQLQDLLGCSLPEILPCLFYIEDSPYVEAVVWGERCFTANELRERLDLESTAFTVSGEKDSLQICCKGQGHGLGMSLYGACRMAEEGKKAKDILAFYYPE